MLILGGPKGAISTLAFAPGGEYLAAGAKDGLLWVWDAAGVAVSSHGRYVRSYGGVHTVAFHPDGDRLAHGVVPLSYLPAFVIETSPRIDTYSTGPGVEPGAVTGLAFLDAATLVVGTGGRAKPEPGALMLWDRVTEAWRKPVFREPAGVRAVATHPPSRLVAWANGSRRVTVWDVLKSDPVHFNQPHVSPAVAFHPDGELLAAAEEWGFRVYDVAKRQEKFAVRGHTGRVSSVAFSPDGRVLATGGWDETVRLWDAGTGAARGCFRWGVGKVFSLAYAPDGLRLAAGGDGRVVVWDQE